ncbi:MAG: hypothetical protein JXQ76_06140 [Campylobacterales bacterium]|nr:hypothetical protein [Campylobacterales bacterium]
MQTLTLNIQDSFVQDFLQMIKPYHDKIELQKDKNLEYDPYFYERQKQLHQDLQEIESGKAEMIGHDELWANLHNHLLSMK